MKIYYHCSECHKPFESKDVAELHFNSDEFEPALDIKIYCNKCKEEMK